SNERVRASRSSVDLVLDQVRQLQHIDDADRDRAIELLSSSAVIEIDLAIRRKSSFHQGLADLFLFGSIEDRGRHSEAKSLRRPAEMRFQHLAEVHARGHADRIEDDVNRLTVRQKI